MKLLPLILIFSIIFMLFKPLSVSAALSNAETKSTYGEAKIKTGHRVEKYPGYSLDGWTSASKLAAQRSHTVAGKDERDFAVFTGIVVILMIFFFVQIIMGRKD